MIAPGTRSYRTLGAACSIAAALVMSACGSTTEISSATSSTAPATTAPPTTAAPTTAPPTTSPATTAPPTSPPPTTAPPTTSPATTAPATTAPPTTGPPAPTGPATAFAAADEQLVEIDVASGAVVRVLDEFFSGIDGVFRGSLRLGPDRSTIWFSEGYEDGWYGCDSSIGSFGRVDAATGEIEVLGVGSNPEPSTDGALVAYVTSRLCLPDPESPANWVLTPGDRIVVRTLATGDEREFVTATPPDSYEAPGAVLGAGFGPGGNLLVLLGDGRLFDVDLAGSTTIQDHPVALSGVIGEPVAATADGLVTAVFGDEGSTDVYSLDAASGTPTLLASTEGYLAVGVGAGGRLVVASVEPVTVSPGADVTVVEPAGDPFVYDIDW